MKKIIYLMGLCSVFLLSGCEETKSVEWWSEHHDEAVKKEVECKKAGSDSQNCRNVKEANFRYQQSHAIEPSFRKYDKELQKKLAK